MRIKYKVLCIILLFSFKVNAKEFKVQLAAFVEKAPFTRFVFAGINDVYLNIDQNNIYRYYLRQTYKNRQKAELVKKLLINRGFLNAQVVNVEKQMMLCGKPCPYASPTTTFSSDDTEILQVKSIFFGFDKSVLDLNSQKKLDLLYEALLKNPNLKVKILGHADSKGSAEYNINLSKRRARAARNYLISKGLHANRINAIVFGESTPIKSNIDQNGKDSPFGRKYNRRVVVALYDNKGEIVSSDNKPNEKITSKTVHLHLKRAFPRE
jgi:outer membrane protein OmpA-like peptidoglycan-associated protein